ncbi:MAG: hypothetical protein FWC90_06210, partial [Oscillospiraceae bacterium]|nr:hypothetical protein [Oscillospiraceae bacterium]
GHLLSRKIRHFLRSGNQLAMTMEASAAFLEALPAVMFPAALAAPLARPVQISLRAEALPPEERALHRVRIPSFSQCRIVMMRT